MKNAYNKDGTIAHTFLTVGDLKAILQRVDDDLIVMARWEGVVTPMRDPGVGFTEWYDKKDDEVDLGSPIEALSFDTDSDGGYF